MSRFLKPDAPNWKRDAADTVNLLTKASKRKLEFADAPASAGASGTPGQIAYDTGFIYICTAANTWKRAALSTW